MLVHHDFDFFFVVVVTQWFVTLSFSFFFSF